MKEGSPEATTAETRRLAVIMFTDIVGFSRQMGSNEARTLRLLEVHNHLIQQVVAEHHGHVIKTVGDAFLVDFPLVVHAVQCAQGIHVQLRTHNVEKDTTEQIHVRIGIHLGDIVQREGSVEMAMRLNPHYPPFYLHELGWAYRQLGRYAEAVTTLKQVLSRNPNFLPSYFELTDHHPARLSVLGPLDLGLCLSVAEAL